MIEFKWAPHTSLPTDVVEVWINGRMLAVIYPHEDDGIKVISKYFERVVIEDVLTGLMTSVFTFKERV